MDDHIERVAPEALRETTTVPAGTASLSAARASFSSEVGGSGSKSGTATTDESAASGTEA